MELNQIENNPKKFSLSFKIFNFLCAPAMFYIMILSYITGHSGGVYLVDKKSLKEDKNG